MKAAAPLDLAPERSLAGRWRVVAGALVVPPDVPDRPQACGVFDATATPVTESLCWSESLTEPVTRFPVPPDAAALPLRRGTWLFGGVMSGHFGHLVCEATGRLWALGEVAEPVEGVIFFARPFDKAARIGRAFTPFVRLFGAPQPIIVTAPERVERLIVPMQGFGAGELLGGAPESRAWLRANLRPDLAPASGRQHLYLSRTRVPARRGRLFAEARVEALFAAAGYAIIFPEELSFDAQVALYRGATHVVGTEGSPFHLLAFAGRPGCRVAMVARRQGPTFPRICDSVGRFLGTPVLRIEAMRAQHRVPGKRNANLIYLEPTLAGMAAALVAGGFLPAGTRWHELDDATRAAERAALEQELGERLAEATAATPGAIPGEEFSALPRRRRAGKEGGEAP